MKRSTCIGNSSSFVRDSGFLGTPVVLLGNRQKDREISPNVLPLVDFNENSLLDAANQQIKASYYPSSNLYGDGKSSERFINLLDQLDVDINREFLIID